MPPLGVLPLPVFTLGFNLILNEPVPSDIGSCSFLPLSSLASLNLWVHILTTGSGGGAVGVGGKGGGGAGGNGGGGAGELPPNIHISFRPLLFV